MRYAIVLILALTLLPACQTTKAQTAATLGTLAGATLGALTFKNKNSGAAIGGGAGMLVGYIIGNEMDKLDRYDQAQISNALETMPSGRSSAWTNPDTNTYYEATPAPVRRQDNGRIERDVTLRAQLPDGSYDTVYAKAYRQPDGTWQLVQ